METRSIKIRLHNANIIKRFIEVVRGFYSEVDLITDHAYIDAKSIMGIYAVDLSQDTFVKIVSSDSEECERFELAMEEFR